MRKTILISLWSLAAAVAYALPMNVECVGKATQRINGTDTLFIFKDNIELHSKIGEVNWYRTDGTLERSNSEDLSPSDGGYYIVKGGVEYAPFYVFSYNPSEIEMTVEITCEGTELHLTGDVSSYTYLRRDGTTGTFARACSIDYNELKWNGEEWVDSAVQTVTKLSPTVSLPPLYGPTAISLCCDKGLRDTLELEPVCMELDITTDQLRAVAMELVTLGTARENDPNGNNELERPTEQKLDPSKSYSGALEVAFYSNPTPAAQFFRWSIYKSTERLATRNDQDIRYLFSEPGSYRVVCEVNNAYCKSDSSEMVINISESYLRVPNVFTPNGDGKNDEFRVAYRSLREFHCWVYNRWGKLVYHWTDPSKGWDGTINGKPAAEGAYFYVIRALGTDADKNASYIGLKAVYNKRKQNADESVIGIYQLSGDINLLRGKK